VLDLHAHNRWDNPTSLLSDPSRTEENNLISELLLFPQTETKPLDTAAGCLSALEDKWLATQLALIRKRLAEPHLSREEMEELLRHHAQLDKRQRELGRGKK